MLVDFNAAWQTVQRMANGLVASLPRLGLALLIVLLFYGIGKGVRTLVRRNAQRRGEVRTLELAIGRLAQAGILVVGVLIALTAAFPSFTPANLVSTLGIGGVAIGFAFKDIFQ
ncbi:MAG: mechanosensitive ion channel family protein, partial [Gemmatimonas sp.]